MMVNYLLFFISAVIFLSGMRLIAQNGINSKSKRIVFSLISSIFIIFCILFLAADFITGNGVDYPLAYFIKDSFTGLGIVKEILLILVLIGIWGLLLAGSYYTFQRFFNTPHIRKIKLQWIAILLVLISFILSPFTIGLVNIVTQPTDKNQENRYDPNRFIAHAGGSIDGNDYTNSLEALNQSYRKGFRLFELDILKTSDSIFVAVHDWDQWKTLTNYQGELPPSRSVFKQYKLLNNYTTLDIDDINDWFTKHEDAILVTDKVNLPVEFSNVFIDPERLMMELFTIESLKEASELNIKSAMPSWGILKKIKGDKIKALKELGVTDLAASRRIVKYNIPFINQLKENGIRVYVFHVNYDKGKDEAYVVRNDMDYIYGMYADDFDFCETLDCN